MIEREGGPYPSLYQKRFSSGQGYQDGWNRAIALANLDYNRKKPDQDGECIDCGVNGHTQNGRLIRWQGGSEMICMSCYQRRYYRTKTKISEN